MRSCGGPRYWVVVVETPLSGRIRTSPACSTHRNVIEAPPRRTPGMFDVVDWVTSSNSLFIEPQNVLPSTISFPATAVTSPKMPAEFVFDE